MANPNLAMLIAMAQAMGPLCEQVVFVGGCATGLLSDPERELAVKTRLIQIANLKEP